MENIEVLNYLSRDNVSAGNNQEFIVKTVLQPSKEYRQKFQHRMLRFVFVIDTSGSMRNQVGTDGSFSGQSKLQVAHDSLISIIDTLDEKDLVNLIYFNTDAYSILNDIPASQKNDIINGIDTIYNYNGSTDFVKVLNQIKLLGVNDDYETKVLFLTDGRDTSNRTNLVFRLTEELSNLGFGFDCFGIGLDFKFDFIKQMTSYSNGLTVRLGSLEEVRNNFNKIVNYSRSSIASNVFLTLFFSFNVRNIEIYSYMPEVKYLKNYLVEQPNGKIIFKFRPHSIKSNKKNIFIIKFNADISNENECLLFKEKLDYFLPHINKIGKIKKEIRVSFSDIPDNEVLDSDIEEIYYETEIEKFQLDFNKYASSNWEKALWFLEEMIKRAENLRDTSKLNYFEKMKTKLKEQHHLTQDDLNIVANASSRSTRKYEGDIGADETNDVL